MKNTATNSNIEPLEIGPLRLETNLALAPMAGYCELPFRLVVRKIGGVGLTFTSLMSAMGLRYGSDKTVELASSSVADRPLVMQFFGAEPDALSDAARWGEDNGADVIDINMGCSVPKVVRNNGGSALLKEPDAAIRLMERIVTSVRKVPVTVKMRLGWADSSIVAPYLAARFEDAGVAAITVHGRTAAMKFRGHVRLDDIAAVVAAVKRIPIIGNGDVRTPQDAADMLSATGCRGVMIGRAALSSPWIFRDTWAYLTTGQIPPRDTLQQKCGYMREHFEHLVSAMGERRAAAAFRKSASWYAKQLGPCKALRERLSKIQSAREFNDAVGEFLSSSS